MRYGSHKHLSALAGAAVGVTYAGAAAGAATLHSTAPAGYAGQSIIAYNPNTLTFDVSGAGFDPLTITGKGAPAISITASTPNTIATDGGEKAMAYTTIPNTYATTNSSGTALEVGNSSNFGPIPMYGETQYTGAGGAIDEGYFKGTYVSSSDTFTLTDYGTVSPSSAAPEPSTWALLATGAAGMALVLRRRRKDASNDGPQMLPAAAAA